MWLVATVVELQTVNFYITTESVMDSTGPDSKVLYEQLSEYLCVFTG